MAPHLATAPETGLTALPVHGPVSSHRYKTVSGAKWGLGLVGRRYSQILIITVLIHRRFHRRYAIGDLNIHWKAA